MRTSIVEVFLVCALGAGTYLATNTDNVVLLAAMLAQRPREAMGVFFGFGISVLIALGAGYLIALESNLIPVRYLGLLGVVPLAIGVKGFGNLLRGRRTPRKTEVAKAPSGRSATHTTAVILVSNSTDTVIVLSALLADSSPGVRLLILLSCVGTAVVVAGSAAYVAGHPRLERRIQTTAPTLTPFVLTCVGIYILVNTATDLLPG